MTKKVCGIIALVVVSALIFSGCKASEPLQLTVVSYNIRYGTANDGDNSWEFRRPATPAMINEIQPDFFGVQEAIFEQVEYIKENCPDYAHYGVGREDGIDGGEHMSIFYRKDKFNLLSSETFWLSETPDVPSKGWDAACKRTATAVLLEHKASGKKVFYVNTHLDHVGDTARLEGLKLIVNRIAQMNPNNYPLILTGDFNMRPTAGPIQELNKMMNSARLFAEKTDSLSSFNAWSKPLSEADVDPKFKTLEAKQLQIDYIYYTPDGILSVPEFETVTREFASVPFISDHYPVKALIVLK